MSTGSGNGKSISKKYCEVDTGTQDGLKREKSRKMIINLVN